MKFLAQGLGVVVALSLAGSTASASAGPAPEDAFATTDGVAGEPLRIGWANADTGTPSFPAFTEGAVAATAYINAELGGISGRPVELVTCSVGYDPESNQSCGQQFANDSSIPLGVMGISVTAGPFYEAMGDKPVLGGVPVTSADYQAANAFFYYGGAPASQAGFAEFALERQPAKVAYFHEDNAAGVQGAEDFAAALEESGIEVNQVANDSTTSDVLPQVTQAEAADADLIVISVTNCIPIAEALETVGATGEVAAASSCVSEQNIEARPELFEGWNIVTFAKVVNVGEGVDEETDFFKETYPEYSDAPIANFAEKGWGLMLTLHEVLDGLDPASLDAQTIEDALTGYNGPVVMGTPEIACPGADPYPAVCSQSSVRYQITDGVPVPTTGR